MVEGKRRCHSTSEAPYLMRDLLNTDTWNDPFSEDDDCNSSEAVHDILNQRQISVERRDFSRRLSLTTERMKETRRLMTKNSSGSLRTGSSILLIDPQDSMPVSRPVPPHPLQRRMSVLIDEQRQPVALLQSDGKAVSIRPVPPVLRRMTSSSSVTKLFDDPYGLAEEPKMSNIPIPQLITKSSKTDFLADKKEFEKQCQWKGERVKSTDYMLLNITALFIITVVIAAIIFFSLWRDVSGEMWVLYLGLGASATLVFSALLLVRLHFCLKSQGYNLLFRSQNNPHSAPPKKDLDKSNPKESDIQPIEADIELSSEKVNREGKDKRRDAEDEAVTLL